MPVNYLVRVKKPNAPLRPIHIKVFGASSVEAARKIILDTERCPGSSILSIEEATK